MKTLPVNDIRMNVLDRGEGPPLVMLHGLSDDCTFWLPLVERLSPPFRVVAPDLRGHGESDKPPGPYSIKQIAADVAGMMTALGIPEARVAGFSMGSAVALQLALDHPERVRSLALLSAFVAGDPGLKAVTDGLADALRTGGFGAFFDAMLPLVISPDVIEANREILALRREEKVRTESAPAVLAALDACMRWDVRAEFGRVRCPVFILSGREDRLTPPALAGAVHADVPGSRWEILDGVGHNLLLPDTIEKVAAHLRAFFA